MEDNVVKEWLYGMFQKIEGMWSDVHDTIRQETVNYVESRVQTVGTDVKSFCSEFIQEVFSSSPAQIVTNHVHDSPLVEISTTGQPTQLMEGTSNENHGVKMPDGTIQGCVGSTSINAETSGNGDDFILQGQSNEPDVVVPTLFDNLNCQSSSPEDQGKNDLLAPGCKSDNSTCDSEDAKTSLFLLERHCENEEYLNTLTGSASENDHPISDTWQESNTSDATSSSEQKDASGSCSFEWDNMAAGIFNEGVECALLPDGNETMLGESCVVIKSSELCSDQYQLTKRRAYMKMLLEKLGSKIVLAKDRHSIPQLNADKSRCGGHATRELRALPVLPNVVATSESCEFDFVEHDWEII